MMVIPADLTWVCSIFQLNVFLKDVKFIFTRIFFLVEGLFPQNLIFLICKWSALSEFHIHADISKCLFAEFVFRLNSIKIVFPEVCSWNIFLNEIFCCKSILLENKMQQGGNLNTSRVCAWLKITISNLSFWV